MFVNRYPLITYFISLTQFMRISPSNSVRPSCWGGWTERSVPPWFLAKPRNLNGIWRRSSPIASVQRGIFRRKKGRKTRVRILSGSYPRYKVTAMVTWWLNMRDHVVEDYYLDFGGVQRGLSYDTHTGGSTSNPSPRLTFRSGGPWLGFSFSFKLE